MPGARHDGPTGTATNASVAPAGYGELLTQLKDRVRRTRLRAVRAASTEVRRLCWSIGRDILGRQLTAGWGSKVVDRLSTRADRDAPEP